MTVSVPVRVVPPVVASTTLSFGSHRCLDEELAEPVTVTVSVPLVSGHAVDVAALVFEPAPSPWKQQVQSTGSGEEAVVQNVTWTGGHVPTGEDAVFRFNASAGGSKTYTFSVRQTYSDGSVVDWNGPESSDTPAPTVQVLGSFGGSSSSTLGIVAIALAAAALLIAVLGLTGGKRPLA